MCQPVFSLHVAEAVFVTKALSPCPGTSTGKESYGQPGHRQPASCQPQQPQRLRIDDTNNGAMHPAWPVMETSSNARHGCCQRKSRI